MKKIGLVLLAFILILTSCTSNNMLAIKEVDQEDIEKSEVESNEFEDKYKYTETVTKPVKLEITNKPAPLTMLEDRGKLDKIPKYDPNDLNAFAVDFRGYDLRHLEIGEDRLEDLMTGSFNTATKWPEKLPKGFNPSEIIEIGKNPGLNVRKLHEQGITGKGIGIAIIDQSLLVDHKEYKDQLRLYEEINCEGDLASMHGAAVASIAVGKTVGVAPDADLYYVAETHGEFKDQIFEYDFTWLAMSIDRILEVNKTLPNDRKIRVISISVGWSPDQKGYKETVEAVNRAKEQGIFIVSSSLEETYGFNFNGIGRTWYSNPDDSTTYVPGYWWKNRFYNDPGSYFGRRLLVPMDGITTADPLGSDGYVYYPRGGWSWSIPYIAGLYALACQAEQDITPFEFWESALKTGDTVQIEKDGKEFKLEKIVNPVRLLELLQQQ
ncbi:MAG: S8/S53 family peptidase [Thermotaleaceae bacterium]